MDALKKLRQHLHKHPELSGAEHNTAQTLKTWIQKNAPNGKILELAGAGFAAIYEGKSSGKTILLRSELDALPITETNPKIAYQSVNPGVGHHCGHDGHSTIIAGVAQALSKSPPKNGKVILLFQPAEETGTGAKDCLVHPNYEFIQPDYAFALHNLPGFPLGSILCKKRTFSSSVEFLKIKFLGKECHSAHPETGKSPSLALGELLVATNQIPKEVKPNRKEKILLVPILAQMGVPNSGVSPRQAELQITLRAHSPKTLQKLRRALTKKAQEIGESHQLATTIETLEEFPATLNDPKATELVRKSAKDTNSPYIELSEPFPWGEDFGAILQKTPNGALFGLGAGETHPSLHHSNYDFPDELLQKGVEIFLALIKHISQTK